MNRAKWVVLGCLAIGIGTYLWSSNKTSPSPSHTSKPKHATVVVKRAVQISLFNSFRYPAKVVSEVNAQVRSNNAGTVTEFFVSLGQTVKKGQHLLLITHTDPVYSYKPVRIQSPISGVISAFEVTLGSQVMKDQVLIKIVDPKRIRLEMEVAVQDYARIQKNMTGQFSPSYSDNTMPVIVKGVSPFVDPASGTSSIHLNFVRKKESLLPGVVGSIVFKTNERKGFLIPTQAIKYKGEQASIGIVENNQVKKINIKLGRVHGGHVEVTQGLKDNMYIIVRSNRFVSDGDPVTLYKKQSS